MEARDAGMSKEEAVDALDFLDIVASKRQGPPNQSIPINVRAPMSKSGLNAFEQFLSANDFESEELGSWAEGLILGAIPKQTKCHAIAKSLTMAVLLSAVDFDGHKKTSDPHWGATARCYWPNSFGVVGWMEDSFRLRADATIDEILNFKEVEFLPTMARDLEWNYESIRFDVPFPAELSDIAAGYLAGDWRSYVLERYLFGSFIWSELSHLIQDSRTHNQFVAGIPERSILPWAADKSPCKSATLNTPQVRALSSALHTYFGLTPDLLWQREWAFSFARARKLLDDLSSEGVVMSQYCWLILEEAEKRRPFF